MISSMTGPHPSAEARACSCRVINARALMVCMDDVHGRCAWAAVVALLEFTCASNRAPSPARGHGSAFCCCLARERSSGYNGPAGPRAIIRMRLWSHVSRCSSSSRLTSSHPPTWSSVIAHRRSNSPEQCPDTHAAHVGSHFAGTPISENSITISNQQSAYPYNIKMKYHCIYGVHSATTVQDSTLKTQNSQASVKNEDGRT